MSRYLSLVNNLKLKDLMALSILLKLKSVSAAADELGIAQPNMSRCFTRLKDYFQDPLLVRSRKEMLLTMTAEKLQKHLNDLEGILKEMEPVNFDPSTQVIEFIVALPDYVAQNVFNDILPLLMSAYDNIFFKLISWNAVTKDSLIHGDIHLAISLDNKFPGNIYRRKIDEDNLVCVVRKGHPIELQEGLTLDDLYRYSHVLVSTGGGWSDRLRERLDSRGDLLIRLKVPGYGIAFSMIEKTDLITIVPRHVIANTNASNRLTAYPLPFVERKLEYSLCWHERFHHDPAHKWLREKLFPLVLNHPKQLSSPYKGTHDG